jgi:hypothetical protein
MNTAKKVILPGVFTALLIGAQLVLSGISGVELVTVLLLTFVYKYGIKQGVLVATAFPLLRCFLFGFFPNVVILYLVYYNLFALVFGGIGRMFKGEYTLKKHILLLCLAVVATALFTLIDDVVTPLTYAFTWKATKAYFLTSLYTMLPHILCVGLTVIFIFPPLLRVLRWVH